MGFLAYPIVNESNNYQGDKKQKKFYMSGNYTNRNALKFVIEDVTRSRPNEKYYSDLVAYGARGACYGLQAKDITACLECVANAYNIELRGGRRVYHEIFWLSDSDMEGLCYDIRRLWDFTWECSAYYFAQGHQVVFAIHSDGKKYHIHFVLNAINYLSGYKYHTSLVEMKGREDLFNSILQKYLVLPRIPVIPIRFTIGPAYKRNISEGEN